MSEAIQQFLNDMLAEIDKATSAKVTKAMRLFMQVDDVYKGIVISGTQFDRDPRKSGYVRLTAPALREWFDTLDTLDELDNLIDDMEDEARAANGRHQSTDDYSPAEGQTETAAAFSGAAEPTDGSGA